MRNDITRFYTFKTSDLKTVFTAEMSMIVYRNRMRMMAFRILNRTVKTYNFMHNIIIDQAIQYSVNRNAIA